MTSESETRQAASINAADSDVEELLQARLRELSLEQKVRLLTGADFWALEAEPAVGLRRVVCSDGPAGVRGERWDERDTSANIPSSTAIAATWDAARVERLGRLLAAEARRKGVDWLLAPTVNLHRSPYGGRHFECFSEDPLLTARIGAAYVRGVQAGGVAATAKHFVANDSETERFTLNALLDERALRELYLAPFETMVRETGAWAVMAAYNSVNGTTMSEHPMLRDVLKDEWGFDGVVVSDWFAARSTEPAGRGALDLAMPGPTGPWGDALIDAVRSGAVDEVAIDDKVLRLLRLAARVGALDGVEPMAPTATPVPPDHVATELRAAAAAGFVLVRNESGLLPLPRSPLGRVAVLGPNAAQARTLGGGSALVFPSYTVSPLDGLRRALGPDVQVDHSPGVRSYTRLPVASIDLLRLPDSDEPGVDVRFVAADGTVLGSEHRQAASFTWLNDYQPGLPADRVATVEVHGRLRATEDGAYQVGGSGLGRFRLTIGGTEAFNAELALAPGADPVEGLMRPPQQAVPVTLRAGEEAPFVLRFEHVRTSETSFAVGGTMFQLTIDPPHEPDDVALDRAAELAAAADVAVVVVGTTEEVESEGFDRDSLALPGRQDELVRRVAAANPRTIVVVNSGAPVLMPWADQVPAVLLTWFPGQEFGNALADVLLGDTEPGGRLPTAWPAGEDPSLLPNTHPINGVLAYQESIHIGQRGYDKAGKRPAFPFGHGLGYTTWDYRDVRVVDGRQPDEPARLVVTLRNSGTRTGREVVQAYASRVDSAVDRPERWLAGFATVDSEPGQDATVEVSIPASSLRHWDSGAHAWATEPGRFEVRIGPSSADHRLTTAIEVG